MCKKYFENDATMMKDEYAERKKKEQMSLIKSFLGYAEKQLECDFPKDFAKRLYKISCDSRIPNSDTIVCIAQEWKVWGPYVEQKEYSSFIQREIESLFARHAIATFASPALKGYIGNKVKVVKPIPHSLLSTAVSFSGLFSKNSARMHAL